MLSRDLSHGPNIFISILFHVFFCPVPFIFLFYVLWVINYLLYILFLLETYAMYRAKIFSSNSG